MRGNARIKRIAVIASMLAMSGSMLVGCGNKKKEGVSIYFLSCKPEVSNTWQEIAEKYKEETGVTLKVLTSVGGNHERTLQAEIAKRDMPTIFQVTGHQGYEKWKNYCLDLSDTKLNEWLLDRELAVTDGNGVYALPYVVEGYGIIYNQSIMNKYFALANKNTKYSSMDEITSFEALKAVVEDMTANKQELGIEGVFSSTSFAPGEDWRWYTHLSNVPVYFEYLKDSVEDKASIDFSYNEGFRDLFELYLDNSIIDRSEIKTKTVDDSMQEFALGRTAMVQNGNWAWSQINAVDGCVVKSDDVKYMPLYIGAENEENQGLCIGTENYICINSLATEEQQKASIEFFEWLYGTEEGKKYVTNDLGFIPPFNTFTEAEYPDNPLAKEVLKDMNNESTRTVTWVFLTYPDQKFKDNFSENLVLYARDEISWEEVVEGTKADWAKRKAANNGEEAEK